MRQEGDSCCNGVIERFFRTRKKQAIWGRPFRTAAEVRAGRCAQDRSSRATAPRESDWCLTRPSTQAAFLQVGSPQTRLTAL
jgi:hypothetical protein